jgi:hypothetical protein
MFRDHFYKDDRIPWTISPSQGRYLHTGQHKHRINAHRHPCLKWDSNPRFQSSSERRQFILRPRGHCDRKIATIRATKPSKPSGSICITCFDVLKLCILHTQYICVCRMFLTVNSSFHPKQHCRDGLCNWGVRCFLWGTSWTSIYYLEIFSL